MEQPKALDGRNESATLEAGDLRRVFAFCTEPNRAAAATKREPQWQTVCYVVRMLVKLVFAFALFLGLPELAASSEAAVPTGQVARTKYGCDPEFVHGRALDRALNRLLPEKVWRRVQVWGLKVPSRVKPAGHKQPRLVMEVRSNDRLPQWSDLTLCRVYRELRAVSYLDGKVSDMGDVFPFQEQDGGWFGYALFSKPQIGASHVVIEVRYDASQAWRPVMTVRL